MRRTPIPRRKAARRFPTGAILIALLAVALGVYLYFGSRDVGVEDEPSTVAVSRAPASQAPTQPIEEALEEFALPPLDESDALVRELAHQLSGHPQLIPWLISEDLVRRITAAVVNVAEGESPRKHVSFLRPKTAFQVAEKRGRFYLAPSSYQRYDLIADVVASLDAEGCVKLYENLKPLLEQAYRDLGYPDQSFDDTLRRAMEVLLDTPLIEGGVELAPKVVSYSFRDPMLEALMPAQRHLLRMGPRNVRAVQTKVREIARALNIPETELPPPTVYRPGVSERG